MDMEISSKQRLLIFMNNLNENKKLSKEDYERLLNEVINKKQKILTIINLIEENKIDENQLEDILKNNVLKELKQNEAEAENEFQENMQNNNFSSSTFENNFSINDSKSSRESSPIGDFLLKKKLIDHYTKNKPQSLKSFKIDLKKVN